MTETEEQEWLQRLQEASAETVRKRAAKREERQRLAAARQAGLKERYAAKLARIRAIAEGARTFTSEREYLDAWPTHRPFEPEDFGVDQ